MQEACRSTTGLLKLLLPFARQLASPEEELPASQQTEHSQNEGRMVSALHLKRRGVKLITPARTKRHGWALLAASELARSHVPGRSFHLLGCVRLEYIQKR